MYTIGKLCREFGYSRSTLLYYDSIGLLVPSDRAESGYRLYSDKNREQLEQITIYRQMGLPLSEIKDLLDFSGNASTKILEKHLKNLTKQISSLKKQQYAIVGILKNRSILKKAGVMDKLSWIALLESTGLDDDAMDRWHMEFERMAPEAHQQFLEALGIDETEIKRIRSIVKE